PLRAAGAPALRRHRQHPGERLPVHAARGGRRVPRRALRGAGVLPGGTAMTLADLYQQLILDHAREQHGRGLRDAPAGVLAGQSRQVNPLCGDEVTLRVAVRADGSAEAAIVEDVSWVGEGCSISQAATSVLHDLVVGLTVVQTEERLTGYREMIRSRGQA